MIKLITSLAAISLMGTAAQAEVFTVKAKAVSSNSNLQANSVTVQGIGNSGDRQLENADSRVNAMGYGVDFDFAIAEYGHLGAGVNYVDYMNDNEKVSYTDLSPQVYGAVDFVQEKLFALYAVAGVSYHRLDLKETNMGPVTVSYDDLDLWNYDAGLGVQSYLSRAVTLGLEYKYTGTFQSEGVDLTYSGFGLAATPERLRDIKLMKNEVTASVGMML